MTLSLRDYWIGQGRRKFETDILFDVACRVAEAPEWLGSSYRVLCGQVAVSQQRTSTHTGRFARMFNHQRQSDG